SSDTRSSVFEFPDGVLTMNTDRNADEPLPSDSTLIGWGQVGFLVQEERQTGERRASLLIQGRGDTPGNPLGVEQIDLSNASLTFIKEPKSPIGLGVQFTIPGEEGQADRVVSIHTGIDTWRRAGNDVETFTSHAQDIFVAKSEAPAA